MYIFRPIISRTFMLFILMSMVLPFFADLTLLLTITSTGLSIFGIGVLDGGTHLNITQRKWTIFEKCMSGLIPFVLITSSIVASLISHFFYREEKYLIFVAFGIFSTLLYFAGMLTIKRWPITFMQKV